MQNIKFTEYSPGARCGCNLSPSVLEATRSQISILACLKITTALGLDLKPIGHTIKKQENLIQVI